MDNFEIYIPKEAEVKTIPLLTLPVSTLRRMGLPSLSCGNAKDPSATWISPVEIRERPDGQRPDRFRPARLDTAGGAKARMTSLVTQERTTASGPYLLPFVTSSCTAYKVLGNFLPPGETLKRQSPGKADPIPCGKPPHPYQDAVIIYNRRIYLSVKKTKSVRGPTTSVRGPSDRPPPLLNPPASSPSLNPPASSPLLSDPISSSPPMDAESQETCPVPPEDNAEWERTLLQRFGLTRQIRVALSRIQLSDHEPTEPKRVCFQTGGEEGISQNPEQISVVATSEQVEAAEDVSALVDSDQMILDSSEKVQGTENMSPVDGDQMNVNSSEQVEGAEDQGEVSPVDADQNNGDDNEQVEGATGVSAVDNDQINVDYSEQVAGTGDPVSPADSDGSWPEFPKMLDCFTPNTSMRHTFDFEQSAQEEKIDRIRATLREKQAALMNLHPQS